MKKIVLVALVALASMSAKAQVYMGGELSIWHNKDAKSTEFALAPEIGYNFSEKWAVGGNLIYEHSKEHDVKKNGFAIAPYVRFSYYENELVRLFVDGGAGFSTEKVKDAGKRENGYEVGLKPGIAIKLNEHFSLVAKCGFLGYRNDYIIGQNGGGLSLTSEDLSFGFHYEF
jgi:maltoporin